MIGKLKDDVKVIPQVNDFEIEMTNKGCTDWLKEKNRLTGNVKCKHGIDVGSTL